MMNDELHDLKTALYGRDIDGRPAVEGDIPVLKRVLTEQGKTISQLRILFIAAICLGIANGAGQLLGGGFPT